MRTPFLVLSFFGSLLFFAAPALADTASLTPVADTYTLNSSADVPFGTQDGMYATLNFGPSFARSYLRFDLSQIPAGATVQSAQLQLTLKSYSTTTPAQFSTQRVDATWAEDALTWNTQPSFSDTIQTQAVSYGNPEMWDILPAVQNWLSGTWANNGLVIKSTEGAGTQSTRGYWTREAANPSYIPTLTITYTPPAVPTVPALTISNVTANATASTATISFTTNIAATGTVAYGTTTAYGASSSDTPALLHTITLSNLVSGTTYHFTVTGATGSDSKTSEDITFTTTALIPPPPQPMCGVSPAGTLVKTMDATAVYFIASDCKRHAFPNANIYASWYADFSQVTTISGTQMASFPLGANVTYRPGVRMVKFQSLAKVYALGPKGELRWISSESVATALYGVDWNKKIDDLSDAFFVNYHYGADILNASDFVPTAVTAAAPSIDGSW
ncbi:fibronectin type III domain-containing protein [Patescibacteria group bacterium]|nr:fibronectin type III domain-containing protein [Patescibacteria group bacterium]